MKGLGSVRNTDEIIGVGIQKRLEKTLVSIPYLIPQAGDAFQSFLQAYSTHSKETKHIFNIRHLHLGHVAKSLALKETPSSISQHSSHYEKNKRGKHNFQRGGRGRGRGRTNSRN